MMKPHATVGVQLVLLLLATTAGSAGAYQEAPMLAELVKAGKLPPVEERLPDKPIVVEPVHRIGKYGGTWRRLSTTPGGTLMENRLGYEPLVRWDRTGKTVVPGLAERWESRDGGRTYVLHLRKGLKWSDGHPFTSEDIMFWYEDVILNKELNPWGFPRSLCPQGGGCEVTAPDKYRVEFHFEYPIGIFPENCAYNSHRHWLLPKHYLKQFHVNYVEKEELERRAKALGLDLWTQLFSDKNNLSYNPGLPTLRPWKIAIPPPATRVVVERNPYYWKVDPAGNQLPYIDRIATTVVQNTEVLNLKAMTGETDMQARFIDASKYTLFMENRQKGKYRVLADTIPDGDCIFVNQHSKDLEMRGILQDRRFRIALSVALNRAELIELIFSGLAEPSNAVSSPFDPYYLPEFGEKFIQYDPDLADRLLDEVGLKKGRGGMRRMRDGRPFRQLLYFFPAESGVGTEFWQLVAEYWREVGLDFVVKPSSSGLVSLQVRRGNTNFYGYYTDGMHWVLEPWGYVPISTYSYWAPLYGQYGGSNGRLGVKPPPEIQRLVDWYTELVRTVGNQQLQLELGRRILSQWADECYMIGIDKRKQLTILSNRFRNVPEHIIHSYMVQTPGYLQPEQFYMDQE